MVKFFRIKTTKDIELLLDELEIGGFIEKWKEPNCEYLLYCDKDDVSRLLNILMERNIDFELKIELR